RSIRLEGKINLFQIIISFLTVIIPATHTPSDSWAGSGLSPTCVGRNELGWNGTPSYVTWACGL
uniref:Uncharacterized protein n=1 Tax=Oryza brachyantha TaxID=4533 RepID=J3MZG1_ORYBR